MIIFPAIDIKDKKCVRLYQGEFSLSEIVGEEPQKVAESFCQDGAEYIHMVDLDGAKYGSPLNLEVITKVVDTIPIPVQLGGGMRNMKIVEKVLALGIARVILGTAAINNKLFLVEAVRKYGSRIAVGIDAKDGLVAAEGWLNVSKIPYLEFAKQIEEIGVETIIFTDIGRDGTLKGVNIEAFQSLKNAVSCNVIASGGVKNIEDIQTLQELDAYGVITGKALYAGALDLKEAIAVGKKGRYAD